MMEIVFPAYSHPLVLRTANDGPRVWARPADPTASAARVRAGFASGRKTARGSLCSGAGDPNPSHSAPLAAAVRVRISESSNRQGCRKIVCLRDIFASSPIGQFPYRPLSKIRQSNLFLILRVSYRARLKRLATYPGSGKHRISLSQAGLHSGRRIHGEGVL